MRTNRSVRGFELTQEGIEAEIDLPERGTRRSAGYDLYSRVDITVPVGETKVIPTGVTTFMLPDEWLHIKARSGLSFKKGIIVGAGVVDSDYFPQEIGVVIHNFGKYDFHISTNDRIAQGIFGKYLLADGDDVAKDRNGGFGSTGK